MLAYEILGDPPAPVIVLGGSLGTTRTMWHPQMTALAADYRVVAFDHRGHSDSPAPPGPYRIDELGAELLDLLDRLQLPRVCYAGLSLGGMLGMWLAAHAPRRVQRLALLCTSAHLPPAQAWLDRACQVRAHGTASITETIVQRWFTPEFRYREPQVVSALADSLASIPAEGYAGCCAAMAEMDLRPVLPRITAPTLVIAGAEDPATPPVHAQQIADAVPGARLEILSPGAHLLNVEQAPAVTRLLRSHFRRHDG